MTQNNYPEGLDELATEVADNMPECVRGDSYWDRIYDFEPAELRDYARALLDALAERGYVLVDAKKQEPAGYFYKGEEGYWHQAHDPKLLYSHTPLYEHPAIPGRVALPDGWKMVPVEPTPEMLDAVDFVFKGLRQDFDDIYRAMLSAAPTPPTQPQWDGSLRREAE